MKDGFTHVTTKSETLKRWQETDPVVRNEVYESFYQLYMMTESDELRNALAVSRCLLMELSYSAKEE
jgi:hypothetical protein